AAARTPIGHDRAEDPDRVARRARQAVGRALGLRHESRTLDQVAGRISADGQLREKHEVGFRLLGPAPETPDLLGIAGEIPDGRIDLGDRDPQRPSPVSQRSTRGPKTDRLAWALPGATRSKTGGVPPWRQWRRSRASVGTRRPPAARLPRPSARTGPPEPFPRSCRRAPAARPWRRRRGRPQTPAPRRFR